MEGLLKVTQNTKSQHRSIHRSAVEIVYIASLKTHMRISSIILQESIRRYTEIKLQVLEYRELELWRLRNLSIMVCDVSHA